MSNHTVSWNYTLSTRVSPPAKRCRGGSFHKTNQALPSSMSLEKRVRMRPRGVVSKNRMGLRRIWRNSLSWSAEAAFTVHCQHKQQPCLNARRDTCKQTTRKHTETIAPRKKQSEGNCLLMCGALNTQEWINTGALTWCLQSYTNWLIIC